MTLLASDAIAHIKHTLASEDVPDVGPLRILNDAGQHLVNMHNWQWCEGAQSNLSLTANQDYVWLPDNFRELIAVQPVNGLNQGFRITTQDRLLELRALAVTNSFEFNAAIVHAPRAVAATGSILPNSIVSGDDLAISDAYNPTVTFTFGSGQSTATQRYYTGGATAAEVAASLSEAINDAPSLYLRATVSSNLVTVTHQRPGTRGNGLTFDGDPNGDNSGTWTLGVQQVGVDGGPVRPRLDLWPTPGQDELDRLMVYYRAGWGEIESDGQLIPIPDWIESLYLQIVRAFARGYERESEAAVDQRLMLIAQGSLVAAAKLRDKEMMPNIGPMRGGAAQTTRRTYDHLWNFTGVSAPS